MLRNPVFIFFLEWLFIIIGLFFPLLEIIIAKVNIFHFIIISTLYISLLIILINSIFIRKIKPIEVVFTKKESLRINYLIYIFVLLEIIQIVISGGLPILWLLKGVGKTYVDFGIKSVNGFLNSIYMVLTTSYFLLFRLNKKRKYFVFVALLYMWPILILSRQLLMSVFLQCLSIYLINDKKNTKKAIYTISIFLIIFILLGNLRTPLSSLIGVIKPIKEFPPSLYSLLWIYAYFVTPSNNIIANIQTIEPNYNFIFELNRVLPSILRFPIKNETGFKLVVPTLNVSTIYQLPLMDFGVFYSFLFVIGLLIISNKMYLKTRDCSYKSILNYSVIFGIVAFSFFDNLVFNLPFIFEFVIIFLISKNNRFKLI